MRLSQKHKARVQAQKAQKTSKPVTVAEQAKVDELLVVAVESAVKGLHDIPQGELRVARKKALLAEFIPQIADYLADENACYQNLVFAWCTVWLFDVGMYELGIKYAKVMIERDLKLPAPPFKNSYSATNFLADNVMEIGYADYKAELTLSPIFDAEFEALVESDGVHDVLKAKLLKVAARFMERNELYQTCIDYCKLALQYDAKAQVKTMLDKATKALAKIEAETEQAKAAEASAESADSSE